MSNVKLEDTLSRKPKFATRVVERYNILIKKGLVKKLYQTRPITMPIVKPTHYTVNNHTANSNKLRPFRPNLSGHGKCKGELEQTQW